MRYAKCYHASVKEFLSLTECVLSRLPWRVWFEASFPPLYLSLLGYRLLIWRRGEVKVMGVAFRGFLCGNALCLEHSCFNSCLIFRSWVQHSVCTSARGRSEELLLQLFFPCESYADVGAFPEGKRVSFSLCYV